MRSEVDRVVALFERAWDGDAWHGTPLQALFAGVSAPNAAAHLVPHPHSIWQLTHHITFWLDVVRLRLGGTNPELRDGDDWVDVGVAEEPAWHAVVAQFDRSYHDLLEVVRGMSDADLERPVAGKDYSNHVMIHGALQHSIFHGGQIAMLRRIAANTA